MVFVSFFIFISYYVLEEILWKKDFRAIHHHHIMILENAMASTQILVLLNAHKTTALTFHNNQTAHKEMKTVAVYQIVPCCLLAE